MTDRECVAFLQWALPRLGMRWPGFRRVRGQVCKRVQRRLTALGLSDTAAYRERLVADPAEWPVLDGLCRVTISRFHRDRGIWEALRETHLPALAGALRAAGAPALRAWSAGCGSGEEPYTLAIVWVEALAPECPGVRLELTATDADRHLLHRAGRACYPEGTLRELPAAWREVAFVQRGEEWCLREAYRAGVAFRCEDVRRRMPAGPFHLILCRYLAFTYFDAPLQREIAAGLRDRLAPGGLLVLGTHETLPGEVPGLVPVDRQVWARSPAW